MYHTYLKGFHINHLFLVWFFVYHPHRTSSNFHLTCLTSHIALEVFIFIFYMNPMFFGMIVYYVHIALQWFSTSTPGFWYDCILDTEFQMFSSMSILYFVGWLSTWLYGMSRFSSTFVLYFVVWLSTIHKTCQRFSTVTFHFVVWLYRNMAYTLFYSMTVHCRYDILKVFYITFIL